MIKKNIFSLTLVCVLLLGACNDSSQQEKEKTNTTDSTSKNMNNEYAAGTFGHDVNFLKKYDTALIQLTSLDGLAQILVSPKYQGKVFTSTAEGLEGQSFGWVNYKAFDAPIDPHINAYGGEDRLWLGPEGGKFSLYFKPGVKQEFENWHTPTAFDIESWTLKSQMGNKIAMTKDMDLKNYANTRFQMTVDREVELLDLSAIETLLEVTLNKDVKSVGFKTINSITNKGQNIWDETSGAPCTWNLDMFTPSEKCTIIIPYLATGTGKIATTDYFGEIPADRIKFQNGVLFFKADGKSRGKLGIVPPRVKNVAGSYDGIHNVLTIAKFDVDNMGKYLNQEWRTDRAPFSGDGMNAYNDGPLEDGSQLGPFYEIESVSPAAFLKPGEKQTHQHSVFHFTGDKAALSAIAKKVFGTTLEEIENVF